MSSYYRIVTRYIVGYKKEESDHLLKFLYDHIALSQDLQARIRWKAGTVVVWDVSYSTNLFFLQREKDADHSRTVWHATLPFSIGRMASADTSLVSHPRLSLPMRHLLRVRWGAGSLRIYNNT